MATKTELEELHNRYHDSVGRVAQAEAKREYQAAIELAEASLPLVHPDVTYQRRILKSDHPTAPTVDSLLRIAPPLFSRSSLDILEKWFLTGTRTERNSLPDMMSRIEMGRLLLGRATELWSYLSTTPRSSLRIENLPRLEADMVTLWLNAGLVIRIPRAGTFAYMRVSDTRRLVAGKCDQCGDEQIAPKSHLLDRFRCPTCRQRCQFVITRYAD
jgi:hypothetical protein